MPPADAPARPGDRGAIVLGWLVKLVLGLSVVGTLAFDGLSIASATVTLQDQASAAARAGADVLQQTPTAQAAFDAATVAAVEADGANTLAPADVQVGGDGTVTLTLRRTTPTVVLRHIGWCSDWADRSATASAAPLP